MPTHKRLCITTDADAVTLRLSPSGEACRIPLPEGAFGDRDAMTAAAAGVPADMGQAFRSAETVILVNTDRAVCRIEPLASVPEREWAAAAGAALKRHFPEGGIINEEAYVMDGRVFDGGNGRAALLLAALPLGIAEGLVGFCRALGIPLRRLKRIDLIEHVLCTYYASRSDQSIWLCLPQEKGVRVLSLGEALPNACWSVDNDPLWRERGLQRLWLAREAGQTPEAALLLASEGRLAWMSVFFAGRSVTVTETAVPEEALWGAASGCEKINHRL